MEKSSRRNSYYDFRPISTVTTDTQPVPLESIDQDSKGRPFSTYTAGIPPITVLLDDELGKCFTVRLHSPPESPTDNLKHESGELSAQQDQGPILLPRQHPLSGHHAPCPMASTEI
jgi:hypothetical protein